MSNRAACGGMEINMKTAVDIIKENASVTENEIKRLLCGRDEDYGVLFDSMLYSANGGGKRIRPCLTLEFCRMLGGNEAAALTLGAALEMVHTYSLIHDDMPCMDNDDFRRGRPSNHKVFGEATAMLAGDALLTEAFAAVSGCETLSEHARLEAVRIISRAAGAFGMIGGQQLDLIGEQKKLTPELHNKMNLLKTGALIKAAALLGCVAADADAEAVSKALEYAENVGLAFQVTDDLLDDGREEEKMTYLSFMSREEAKKYVHSLTEKAVNAISGFECSRRENLTLLARYLEVRSV